MPVELSPAAKIALTVAAAQLQRGENPPINITATLVLELEALRDGERVPRRTHDWKPSGTFDTGHQPPHQRWDCECGESEWTADPDGPALEAHGE